MLKTKKSRIIMVIAIAIVGILSSLVVCHLQDRSFFQMIIIAPLVSSGVSLFLIVGAMIREFIIEG